jgi:hypothetical protein
MDWGTNKQTSKERRLIYLDGCGYVCGFLTVLVPRLIAEPAPQSEPYAPTIEILPPNPYIPLAHRESDPVPNFLSVYSLHFYLSGFFAPIVPVFVAC